METLFAIFLALNATVHDGVTDTNVVRYDGAVVYENIHECNNALNGFKEQGSIPMMRVALCVEVLN